MRPNTFHELEQSDPDLAQLVKIIFFDETAKDLIGLSLDVDDHAPKVLRDALRPIAGDFDNLWRRVWAENHTAPTVSQL